MADNDSVADICEVRITAPDVGWPAAHTRRLVEGRVALHTQRRHVPEIIRRTTEAHPDDVPGIIDVAVVDGHPDYLQWVRDETDQGRWRSGRRRQDRTAHRCGRQDRRGSR